MEDPKKLTELLEELISKIDLLIALNSEKDEELEIIEPFGLEGLESPLTKLKETKPDYLG